MGRRSTLMNADNTHLSSLSEKVLGAVFEVSNTLGAGFLVCLLVNFQKPKVEWRRIVLAFQISEPPQAPAVAR
jgi:hypothetical protein